MYAEPFANIRTHESAVKCAPTGSNQWKRPCVSTAYDPFASRFA
jgi:hypothetical protein